MNESAQPISRTPTRARALFNFLAGGGAYLPGIVLMVAGVLKLHEYLTLSPFAPSTGFIPHRFLLAVAFVELVLGLHIVLQYSRPKAWIVAVGLFTAFIVLNLVMIVRGQPACECFGRLSISPWIAVIIDSLSLTSLLVFPPSGSVRIAFVHAMGSFDHRLIYLSAAGVALAATLSLTSLGQAGLFQLSFADGIVAKVEPPNIVASPSQHIELRIVIENNCDEVITIIGKYGTCGIRFAESFPMSIPAMSNVTLRGFTHVPRTSGVRIVPAVLVTDSRIVPILACSTRIDIRDPIGGNHVSIFSNR